MWTYNYNNDYLMHHGVKGMKWGVRKDRYESFRTTRLREKLESGSLKGRKKDRVYAKYNKQKNRDYKRKQYANKHGHVRNIAGGYFGRGLLIGVGVAAATGAIYASKSKILKKGFSNVTYADLHSDTSLVNKLQVGSNVVALAGGAQLLYSTVERGRAISGRYRDGKYDLKKG